MHVLNVDNAHHGLYTGVALLCRIGVQRESRNGPVWQTDDPVTTVYRYPDQRVVFWPERDANPFFHLFEALWMLGGRNDVSFVAKLVSSMKQFSDDGKIFHGAYGYRWRKHFERDQLKQIAAGLQKSPTCRRQMLQMWDARVDLGRDGKDVPCNTVAHFQANRHDELDMSVFCRSNDIVWGCYGANVVHFSMLQEYLATAAHLKLGRYWQISDNWHAYHNTFEPLVDLHVKNEYADPYDDETIAPLPLVTVPIPQWDREVALFLEGKFEGIEDPFLSQIVLPMYGSYRLFQTMAAPFKYEAALELLRERCYESDWKRAGTEWLVRRYENWKNQHAGRVRIAFS